MKKLAQQQNARWICRTEWVEAWEGEGGSGGGGMAGGDELVGVLSQVKQ